MSPYLKTNEKKRKESYTPTFLVAKSYFFYFWQSRKSFVYLWLLEKAVHGLRDISGVYTVVVRICTVVSLLDQRWNKNNFWVYSFSFYYRHSQLVLCSIDLYQTLKLIWHWNPTFFKDLNNLKLLIQIFEKVWILVSNVFQCTHDKRCEARISLFESENVIKLRRINEKPVWTL